jgi:hypothetical protein
VPAAHTPTIALQNAMGLQGLAHQKKSLGARDDPGISLARLHQQGMQENQIGV